MDNSSDFKFLFLTVIVALVLALPIWTSFTQKPRLTQNNQFAFSAERSPASAARSEVSKLSTEVLGVDCSESEIKRDVQSPRIRVKGNNCEDQENLKIQNSTNGYEASLIEPQRGEFTTDYIDLQEGENIILIQSKKTNGDIASKTLRISRRSPASDH